MGCCQNCGIEAPTKYVEFYQNIGALVVRFSKSVKGELCKNCISEHFWPFTLVTICVGWLGFISLIITPFFVLNNVGRYLFALSLPAPRPGAKPPRLTDADIEKIQPFTDALIESLNAGKAIHEVTAAVAAKAGVTSGQVLLYVHALVEAAKRQRGQ